MRTLAQHWKGTVAAAKVIALEAAGKPVLTTITEAERRASVCEECPLNVNRRKSMLENAEDRIMLAMVGGRTTSKDEHLGTCSACSCNLKALVHCMPTIILPIDKTKHPKNCWKHQLTA